MVALAQVSLTSSSKPRNFLPRVEYQVVALQAVMADLLGGDTIHHACGIAVINRGGGADNQAQRQMDIAKRVLQ